MENPKLWIVVAFVVLFAAIGKKLVRAAVGALDARSAKIEAELTAATSLREQAEALLAQYTKRAQAVSGEAEAILTEARNQAEALIADAQTRSREASAKRLQQLEQRLVEENKQALVAARNEVIEQVMDAAKTLVREQSQAVPNLTLVQRVADDLGKRAS